MRGRGFEKRKSFRNHGIRERNGRSSVITMVALGLGIESKEGTCQSFDRMNRQLAPFRHLPIRILLFGLLIVTTAIWACQVPVFRYALERWTPDAYELVVAPGTGGLTSDEEAALNYLTEQSKSDDIPLNLNIQVLEEGENSTAAAIASLFYPGRRQGNEGPPIWQGGLTMENAQRIVNSPARRELATRILKGESSVWLVVESGDAEKDSKAEELLTQGTGAATEMLEIPEGVVGRNEVADETAGPVDQENILQSDVPLKIEFSVLRVNRLDPEEAIFLSMFLNLEDDLGEFASEPMAFPVFGRGRVLEPLIGLGINENNILEHSGYLCGACSCEVKDQNPGMDLLMAVNWDAAMEGSQAIIDKVLPPLEGTAALLAAADATSSDAPALVEPEAEPVSPEVTEEPLPASSPFGRLWIILGAVLVLLGLGSFFILRKKVS
jgi:hypothetical protein